MHFCGQAVSSGLFAMATGKGPGCSGGTIPGVERPWCGLRRGLGSRKRGLCRVSGIPRAYQHLPAGGPAADQRGGTVKALSQSCIWKAPWGAGGPGKWAHQEVSGLQSSVRPGKPWAEGRWRRAEAGLCD